MLGVVILGVGVGVPHPQNFFGKNCYFSHISLDFDLPRQKKSRGSASWTTGGPAGNGLATPNHAECEGVLESTPI